MSADVPHLHGFWRHAMAFPYCDGFLLGCLPRGYVCGGGGGYALRGEEQKKIREICLAQKSRILKKVSEMRFELTQPNGHYPLKVACLPIPPPGHLWVKMNKLVSF